MVGQETVNLWPLAGRFDPYHPHQYYSLVHVGRTSVSKTEERGSSPWRVASSSNSRPKTSLNKSKREA